MTTKKNAATVNGFDATNIEPTVSGFDGVRNGTEGSILKKIVGDFVYDDKGDIVLKDDGTPMVVPKTSANGNKYWLLVFEDGCQFVLTVQAKARLLNSMLDGKPNPDFIPEGIYPGKKYSAVRSDNGWPIVKFIK